MNPKRKLSLVVGGSTGSDPYSPKTWSSSCRHLTLALEGNGTLERALGVDISAAKKRVLMLKNFHSDRQVWRDCFYMDPAYRDALTAALPALEGPAVQIGAMFSLPQRFPSLSAFSYNDGNLAQRIAAGYGPSHTPAKRMDQALDYERRLAHQLTGVLTYSRYLRDSFITDYGVAPEKVHTVGAGVNLEAIPGPSPQKRYDTGTVLMIGKEFERKGGFVLLEAFRAVRRQNPHVELHIVGPDTGLTPPQDGVVFHGFLQKSDPVFRQLLQTASLFVLPSLYEPFGLAPLEAMLHEIPVITTDICAFPEFVHHGVNGAMVSRGSVSELADALLAFLRSPDDLERMGRAAREIALPFTWPKVADRIASVVTVAVPTNVASAG